MFRPVSSSLLSAGRFPGMFRRDASGLSLCVAYWPAGRDDVIVAKSAADLVRATNSLQLLPVADSL